MSNVTSEDFLAFMDITGYADENKGGTSNPTIMAMAEIEADAELV